MSSDSSKDPVESASRGATKAILDFTAERISELITKFRNKEIAFIEDVETINIAKEQRNKTEWKVFTQYIQDKDLRIMFQMGLTLKKLEESGKPIEDLKERIINKYDTRGLHIAQVVQSGIFSKYIGSVLDKSSSEQKLKFEIEKLFKDVEKTVIFIKSTDEASKKIDEIITKIYANSPDTFIISSMGTANDICDQIIKQVKDKITGYSIEGYYTENRKIFFLNKIQFI